MSRIYVALDLETTGLHADRDAIIEIGVVKFRVGTEDENTIVASWSTLVNPGRPIPYRTSRLTGISQAEVERAPRLSVALEQLASFVGNYPVVGHNIAFDLSFLHRQGCLVGNASLDTFELASILLPQAPRYSLAQLANHLGLDLESHHRALEDASATQQLFTRLWQIACQLPRDVIDVINTVAANSPWSLRSFFAAVGREQVAGAESLARPATAPPPVPPPLRGHPASSAPLDADELAALLNRDGAVGRTLTRFEARPQQVQMLRAIVQAFNNAEHLLVEAGTGTGKSLAYLLPAIYQAVASDSTVIISTNTINLQDQLLDQDLPILAAGLEPLGVQFRAAVLKGRTNYICRHRLALFMRRPQFSAVEARALARLLVWLPVTETGDRTEVALQSDEEPVWSEVCADPESCPRDVCTLRSGCFFQHARTIALGSHIVIVNHALLLTDLASETDQTILPHYDYVVIDEAHHLEARATEQLGAELSSQQLESLCRRLHDPGDRRPTGLLPTIAARCERLATPAAADVQRQCGLLGHEVEQVARDIGLFFDTVREALAPWAARGGSEYDHQIRLKPEVRLSGGWGRVIEAARPLDRLERLAEGLAALHAQLRTGDLPLGEELEESLVRRTRELRSGRQELRRIIIEPEANDICWVSLPPKREDLVLHRAPLHVGNFLVGPLFQTRRSVILTSATLQTENSFDYVRERLGLDGRRAFPYPGANGPTRRCRDLALGSPFDYRQSALVYVPTDLPEPNTPNYAQTLHRALIDLARATRGRMLVLLTSKSQLRGVYRAISDPLAADEIVVLGQYMDGGRRQLLERFKTAARCVLLGTQSFWEGVDVPGPALSCLVIARLPFPVPSDPIFSARAETYENHFLQYAVPQTVIRFRQGFGRLIRSAGDRGVVALLDSRVSTKSYGSIFLNSLPAADIRSGPFRDLPPLAERWLAGEHSGSDERS